MVGRIASTVALTQERVKRIEERMLTKDDLSLLLKHMDGFAKRLDNHESRLKRVETPRA